MMILKENKAYLNSLDFQKIIECTPLISIDFIIKYKEKILLAKRKDEPAKGYFFTFGARVLKNESLIQTQKRILQDELGLLNLEQKIEFIGVFEHFYEESIFKNTSTHYVNLAYKLELNQVLNELPQTYHSEFAYFSLDELLQSQKVHSYVKDYFINKGKT